MIKASYSQTLEVTESGQNLWCRSGPDVLVEHTLVSQQTVTDPLVLRVAVVFGLRVKTTTFKIKAPELFGLCITSLFVL